MARDGATPTTVGARPLNRPRTPSVSRIYLQWAKHENLHVFVQSPARNPIFYKFHRYLKQRISVKFESLLEVVGAAVVVVVLENDPFPLREDKPEDRHVCGIRYGTTLGSRCGLNWNVATDDWRRVFTTSSGHVTIAPAVPAVLRRKPTKSVSANQSIKRKMPWTELVENQISVKSNQRVTSLRKFTGIYGEQFFESDSRTTFLIHSLDRYFWVQVKFHIE